MTETEDTGRYEVTYIASPENGEQDPDAVAYNECRTAIHMAEEMLAKMRWHLKTIEQRIKDRQNGSSK